MSKMDQNENLCFVEIHWFSLGFSILFYVLEGVNLVLFRFFFRSVFCIDVWSVFGSIWVSFWEGFGGSSRSFWALILGFNSHVVPRAA